MMDFQYMFSGDLLLYLFADLYCNMFVHHSALAFFKSVLEFLSEKHHGMGCSD